MLRGLSTIDSGDDDGTSDDHASVAATAAQRNFVRGISTTAVGDDEAEAEEAGAAFPPLPEVGEEDEASQAESPLKGESSHPHARIPPPPHPAMILAGQGRGFYLWGWVGESGESVCVCQGG